METWAEPSIPWDIFWTITWEWTNFRPIKSSKRSQETRPQYLGWFSSWKTLKSKNQVRFERFAYANAYRKFWIFNSCCRRNRIKRRAWIKLGTWRRLDKNKKACIQEEQPQNWLYDLTIFNLLMRKNLTYHTLIKNFKQIKNLPLTKKKIKITNKTMHKHHIKIDFKNKIKLN